MPTATDHVVPTGISGCFTGGGGLSFSLISADVVSTWRFGDGLADGIVIVPADCAGEFTAASRPALPGVEFVTATTSC